jgi:hypothetical protein
MINFIKAGMTAFCFLFFSVIMGFAQYNEMQNINTPELSKMIKGRNGLISSSEMQAYQGEKPKTARSPKRK